MLQNHRKSLKAVIYVSQLSIFRLKYPSSRPLLISSNSGHFFFLLEIRVRKTHMFYSRYPPRWRKSSIRHLLSFSCGVIEDESYVGKIDLSTDSIAFWLGLSVPAKCASNFWSLHTVFLPNWVRTASVAGFISTLVLENITWDVSGSVFFL